MSKPRNFAELQRQMTHILRAAGCETATLDARLLLAHIADMSDTQLAMEAESPISSRLERAAQKVIALRANGKPIAKIIGHKEFWGRRFFKISRYVGGCMETILVRQLLLYRWIGHHYPARVLRVGTRWRLICSINQF